ncbi:MAG: T9SS type A sorting domain-containing protein [Flavobacteriales bacterium]|nr:T9SS type A sorting domain-containing protein [Flavobacteriales bacterium]MDG1767743.1 T9SS type A sorting domain-containing protein [Flavobacteriales bacterium]
MKKHTLVLFSILTTITVSAQEVVSTQGDSYSNAAGSLDFTIGELVINTGTDGTNDLTQGFHQTNWNFLGVEDFAPNYEAIIYPNPTEDVLNIRTSTFENVTYTLYDAQGKLVMQDILSAEQTPIQVSELAPGAYSLELIFEEGSKGALSSPKRKTFKLIKQQ